MSSEDHAFGGHFSLLVLHPDHIFFIFLSTTLSLTLWRIGFRGHQRRADRTVLFIIIFVFSWCSRATEKAKKNFTRNVQKTEKLNSAQKINKKADLVYIFFSVEDLKILLSAVTRGYNEMRPKKSSPRGGKNDRLYFHMTFLNF